MPRLGKLPLAIPAALVALAVFPLAAVRGDSGDFSSALCAASQLVQGLDPFGPACNVYRADGLLYIAYPLVSALVAIPFLPLGRFAGAMMFALSSGLLAYGILKRGEPWRLLIFTSGAYLEALLILQWSPLLVAIFYLPNLLPLAIVKPNLALPVILTRLTKVRALGIAAFGLVSLAVRPSWPLEYLARLGTYEGGIPLLTLFGPIYLLALLRYRDPAARFFLLMTAIPIRAVYDTLALWTIPKTSRQMLVLCAVSWPHLIYWLITGYYIPALAIAVPFVSTLCLLRPLRVDSLRRVAGALSRR